MADSLLDLGVPTPPQSPSTLPSDLFVNEPLQLTSLQPVTADRVQSSIPDFGLYKNPSTAVPTSTTYLESQDSMDTLFANSVNPLSKTVIDRDELFTTLNDGTSIRKYDEFLVGADNNEIQARKQTANEKWYNGITKAVENTGLNILGGTVGVVTGLVEGISDGNLAAVHSNDFMSWIDRQKERNEVEKPNYYTNEESKMGWIESLGTANFWANDFLGGMSFVVGTIGSELVWAGLTGGTSFATIGARAALKGGAKTLAKEGGKRNIRNFLANTKTQYKELLRATDVSNARLSLNTARFLTTSTVYESSVEANQSLNESVEKFTRDYETAFGRPPTQEEYASFMPDAVNNANKVFGGNVALLAASNVAMFGTMFGVGDDITRGISKSVGRQFGLGTVLKNEGGELLYKAVDVSKAKKITGKVGAFLTPAFTEGVFEEGGQAVISKTSQNWLDSKYNPLSTKENYGIMDAAMEAFRETYTTKQGIKEIMLGAIIGTSTRVFQRGANRQNIVGTEFSDQLRAQEGIAQNQTTALTRLKDTLLYKNAADVALSDREKNLMKGNIHEANEDLNKAMYSKMLADDAAGMLEETAKDYETMLNMEDINDQLKSTYNVDDTTQLKSDLAGAYRTKLKDFKVAKRAAEALNGKMTPKKRKDFTEEIAFTVFMGLNASNRARDWGQAIGESLGRDGISDALGVNIALPEEVRAKADEVLTKRKEIDRLESLIQRNDQSLSELVPPLQSEEGRQAAAERISKKALKAQKERESLLNKVNTLNTEISTLENEIELFNRASDITFGINPFADTTGDTVNTITERDIVDSLAKIEELDEFRTFLAQNNPAALKALDYRLGEYKKAVNSFVTFRKAFQQMASPSFLDGDYKGAARLLNNARSEEQSTVENNPDAATLVGATQEQIESVLSDPNMSEKDKEDYRILYEAQRQQAQQQTEEVDGQQRVTPQASISEIEPITDSQFQAFERNEVLPTEVYQAIARKIYADGSFTESTDGVRRNIELNEDNLSERQKKILEAENKKPSKDNLVQQEILRLQLGEGDSMVTTPESTQPEPVDIIDNLKQRLQDILDRDVFKNNDVTLENIDPSTPRPTQKEYDRYKELSKNPITKLDPQYLTDKEKQTKQEYDTLKQKIGNYWRLQGNKDSQGDTVISLLEQIAALEENQNRVANNTPLSNPIREEYIKSKETTDDTRHHYDILQTYDKAVAKPSIVRIGRLKIGAVEIANISIEGFSDVTGLGVRREEKLDKDKRNEVYSLIFPDNSTIKIYRDSIRGTLFIPYGKDNQNVQKLANEQVYISTPTELKTVYYPILVGDGQVATDFFDIDSGKSEMDVAHLYNLKAGDSLSVEVPLKDSYNKQLLGRFRKGEISRQELVNGVVINFKHTDSEGTHYIGDAKAAGNINNITDSEYQKLLSLRTQAVNQLLDIPEKDIAFQERVLIPAFDIKVRTVFTGNPSLNVRQSDGQVTNQTITDDMIADDTQSGYIVGTGLRTKDGTRKSKNLNDKDIKIDLNPFVQNLIERYPDRPIPFVVIRQGERFIAYPVTPKANRLDINGLESQLNNSNGNFTTALTNIIGSHPIDVNALMQRHTTEEGLNKEALINELREMSVYNDLLQGDSGESIWTGENTGTVAGLREVLDGSQIDIKVGNNQTPFTAPKVQVVLPNKKVSSPTVETNIESSVDINSTTLNVENFTIPERNQEEIEDKKKDC